MLLGTNIPHELWRALSFVFGMTWEVLWALILGFSLSAVVQAVVSKREMRKLLPDDSPKTLLVATGLGAASSSCSLSVVVLGVKRAACVSTFLSGGVLVRAGAQPYLGARIVSGDEMIDGVLSPRGLRPLGLWRPTSAEGVGGGSIAGAGRKGIGLMMGKRA